MSFGRAYPLASALYGGTAKPIAANSLPLNDRANSRSSSWWLVAGPLRAGFFNGMR